MNLFKNNMHYLQKNLPVLHQIIAASHQTYKAETKSLAHIDNVLIKTNSGECYLHSLYNRDREMARLFASVNRDAKIVVFFGLGMGDAIPYITEYFPLLEHLILIEPNVDVFKQFMQRVDLEQIFRLFPGLSIVLNQTERVTTSIINELLQAKLFRQVELCASLSYRTLYHDYYVTVQETIISAVRRMRGNLATKRFSAHKWLRNEWRNQRQGDARIESVFSRLPAVPVIIVSAGPSLNKNIKLLSGAKEKAIIIAVGSAMTILESHGITPHFRMALDGNASCQAVFDAVDTSRCPLIYSNMLSHGVLPQYEGRKIQMVLATDWVTRYFRDKQSVESLIVNTGYSVANCAFDLVCRCGCSKVILVGQDLCYTKARLHADGAWDDDAPYRIVNEKLMVKVKSLEEELVYTDQNFLNMKASFEEMRLAHPSVDCINATEGGMPIKGIRNQSLRKILDELPEVSDLMDIIEQAITNATCAADEIDDVMELATAELMRIIDINDARAALLSKLQSLEGQTIAVEFVVQELKKIEALSEQLQGIDYYTKVLHPFLADIFYANRLRLESTGNDKAAQVGALIRIYAGEAAELRQLTEYNYKLLLECDNRMPYSVWRELM